MIDLNNMADLTGHLGDNPQSQTFSNGDKIANFSLATTSTYKNKAGEKVSETQWHKCKASKGTADIILKYAKKGSKIRCIGSIIYRNYENAEGKKIYITEINVSQVNFLDNKPTNNSGYNDYSPKQNYGNNVNTDTPRNSDELSAMNDELISQNGFESDEDDLPF